MQQQTSYELAERRADQKGIDEALRGARRLPFWEDDQPRESEHPALAGDAAADLLVVGGGFAGLWTALLAKEREPGRDVVLVEAQRIGWAASGRNGGFCEPSLTHGRANAKVHLPDEIETLERLGEDNLRELLATLERYGIDADVVSEGVVKVATERYQEAYLEEMAAAEPSMKLLRGEQLREEINTPAAQLGNWATADGVVLNPIKLVYGLRAVCERLGVRIYENTPVQGLRRRGDDMHAATPLGTVRARRVALATNGFRALLLRDRWMTVPVYDYAIVTEPLTPEQRESLHWRKRQGLTDLNNRFHYLRLITDAEGRDRVLIGGYDALYHFGRKVRPEQDLSEPTFRRLVVHLGVLFPQLAGVKVSHAWGGMIDTCTRFFSFFTTAHGGRVAAAAGFTGLGVAATRFAGNVMLDLLEGKDTERTRTQLVKKRPFPFPPEPIAWPAIRFTAAQMARSDRREGKRGPWLRLLDAFKLGFDS
ncbi:NAD(P)/FAD-dependent oxidoreductase [Galactobacter valiniphilus]|uniref:FAD-dependent oxidoreductase n=1 Tax=Galactobacter valiniphilus TaxID=2676122 RepID=A0A399JGH5_9MICC|nr:FAD-dependent oxidoreductase [Galactobacter valiniphilus]RII43289.1 FAD-dependent oxidoreductase [Galactobacter valiniphilus]